MNLKLDRVFKISILFFILIFLHNYSYCKYNIVLDENIINLRRDTEISKYIIEYSNQGINIDYITIQNEPEASQVWESCRFTANQEANFAVNYLYPELKGNDLTTKILTWDHNKDNLFNRANEIMSYPNANAIIAGFGHHWYTGDYFENVSKTREKYSDKLIIHTEGCTGYSHFNPDDEIKNAKNKRRN